MSSRHTLIALTVVAVFLGAVVALDRPTKTASRSPRVVPEYREAKVTRVVLARPGMDDVEMVRGQTGWRIVEPVAAPVDVDAVDHLLGTIETLSYIRRGPSPEPKSQRRIAIELAGGDQVVLRIGNPSAKSGGAWVTRDGTAKAFLVEGYAAKALDRTIHNLRRSRVFGTSLEQVSGLTVNVGAEALQLSGAPLALHLDGGGTVRADARALARLLKPLLATRMDRFVDAKGGVESNGYGLELIGEAGTERVVRVGTCSAPADHWLVDSPAGRGCVPAAVFRSLAELAKQPASLIDHLLLARVPRLVTAVSVTVGDTKREARRKGAGWFGAGGARLDTNNVDVWLTRLAHLSTAKYERVAPGKPHATVVVSYAGGSRDTVTLLMRDGRAFARRNDEPVVFQLKPAAQKHLDELDLRWRDTELVSASALGMNRARAIVGGKLIEQVTRGATHSDWSVSPAGKAQVAAIDDLRRRLAQLQAVRFTSSPLGKVRRRIEADFDKTPSGPATAVVVDIGAETKTGCLAKFTKQPVVFELSRADCAALLGPWSKP